MRSPAPAAAASSFSEDDAGPDEERPDEERPDEERPDDEALADDAPDIGVRRDLDAGSGRLAMSGAPLLLARAAARRAQHSPLGRDCGARAAQMDETSMASLHTHRLTARPFSRSDWPLTAALLADPRSARWLTRDGQAVGEEAAARRAAERLSASWATHGVGPYIWTLGARDIGYAGLRPSALSAAPGWEALWAMLPAFHRRGLGFEAASAALAAFDPPAAEDDGAAVWTWTLAENAASRALMAKLGFVFSHEAEWAGAPHLVHRLARP